MHIHNLVRLYHFVLEILSENEIPKEILTQIKGHISITNVRKRMCTYPYLDLGNTNAYTKFGEILSICSQDIEWK